MADVHVVPVGESWAVEVDGEQQGSRHRTQQDAINAGRSVADREGGELVIHGEDGQIREKDSHGNDPPNIPG